MGKVDKVLDESIEAEGHVIRDKRIRGHLELIPARMMNQKKSRLYFPCYLISFFLYLYILDSNWSLCT